MTKYRTVDTSTVAGLKTAERLHTNGWRMVRSGLFLIYFEKRTTSRRARRLQRIKNA